MDIILGGGSSNRGCLVVWKGEVDEVVGEGGKTGGG